MAEENAAGTTAAEGGGSSPPQMLATQGTAASTVAMKSTAVAAFNRFLAATEKYNTPPPPKVLETLLGAVFSDQTIWREFAFFLCDGEIDGDKKGGTIVEYLRKVFSVARDKYGKAVEHCAFYAEVASDADALSWFKVMTRQVISSRHPRHPS